MAKAVRAGLRVTAVRNSVTKTCINFFRIAVVTTVVASVRSGVR